MTSEMDLLFKKMSDGVTKCLSTKLKGIQLCRQKRMENKENENCSGDKFE